MQGEEHSPAFPSLNAAALNFRKGAKAVLKESPNIPPLLVYIYTNLVFLKQLFEEIIISFCDIIIINAFSGSLLICTTNTTAL